eukprot:COSAG06_NODE_45688_length_352_cov_57.328063_1_plen_55_part_00
MKDIGEIFLCIGTADNASKVRVVNDDGDWDDIEKTIGVSLLRRSTKEFHCRPRP